MLARDFTLLYSFSVLKVPSIQELSWEKISLLCLSFSCAKNTVVSYQTKYVCNGGVLYLLFCRSRTRPKTFLQCFALEQRESKAKCLRTRPKGQLISKCLFGVIVSTKIPTKKFDNFCPRI